MHYYYFAYGSNLQSRQMADRCKRPEFIDTAILYNYNLVFRRVASIRYEVGKRTHGVVWRLHENDVRRLNKFEGWPRIYGHTIVPVALADGTRMTVFTYLKNDRLHSTPKPEYENKVRRGYKEWGLPLHNLEASLDAAAANERRFGRHKQQLFSLPHWST